MRDEDIEVRSNTGHPAPAARYLSSGDVETVLQLLIELKDITLSRTSYKQAANLIVELGGRDRLGCAVLAGE
jgi:hypothetical protein